MHPHHPHASESLLVHTLVLAILVVAATLGAFVAVKLAAPQLHALLVGLRS